MLTNDAAQLREWQRIAADIRRNPRMAERLGHIAEELEAAEDARYLKLAEVVLNAEDAAEQGHPGVNVCDASADALRRQMKSDGWIHPIDPTQSLLTASELELIASGKVAGVLYMLPDNGWRADWVPEASRSWMVSRLRAFADLLDATPEPVFEPVAPAPTETALMPAVDVAEAMKS